MLSKDKIRRHAIVLGDMDLLRPLGLAGIACAVVAKARAATRYSRFATRTIDWVEEEHELVDRLCRFADQCAEAPILYFQHDQHVMMLLKHRKKLASYMRFALPGGELAAELIDKIRFLDLADLHRLPMPSTTVLDVRHGTPRLAIHAFPSIIKPATRADRNWLHVSAQGKAVAVDNMNDLREIIPALRRYGRPVLLQQAVPGLEDRIESYHAYIDAEGVVAAEFTGRKVRTFPAQYGHSTAVITTDAEDVRSLGRRILHALAFRGVAKVDFKRSPSGNLLLLEINPRFSLWHHVGAMAGVNIPRVVWLDLTGQPPAPSTRARPGITWSNRMDLRAARANHMTLRQWLVWTLRCNARSGMAADDLLPLIRHIAARFNASSTGGPEPTR